MDKKPIVYSCSGCSVAGQCANNLAVHLNKTGVAEMSCLAGLATGMKSFRSKTIDREIWIIDGCHMQCSKNILQNKGIQETRHIKLHEMGIKKYKEPETPFDFDHLTALITTKT